MIDPIDELFPPAYSAKARPVFVVGAQRSGASLLTLSLGQHPNLEAVLDTNWFGRFAIGIQQAYSVGINPRESSQLDASGFDVADLSAYLGDAIDRFLLGEIDPSVPASGRRWLDGSSGLALELPALMRLFPSAKVIHIFREAGEVVASFTNPANRPLYKRRFVEKSASDAAADWLAAVTACVNAERAFGSDSIMRVRRRDLVREPERVISACLEFLGEPPEPACLRAFRPLDREEAVSDAAPHLAVLEDRARVPETIELLSQMLLDEGTPRYPRDESRILELDMEFGKRIDRENKLIGLISKPKRTTKMSDKDTVGPASDSNDGDGIRSLVNSMKQNVAKIRRPGS